METSSIFKNDIKELYGKDFYYSKRTASGEFNVIKPHSHSHYEIYYLTRGRRRYFINNKIYIVSEGDVILIKPNTIHYTASAEEGEHERIVLNFTQDYIAPQMMQKIDQLCTAACVTIPQSKRKNAEEILDKIANEYKTNDRYSPFLESELLSEFLVTLLRTGDAHEQPITSLSNAEGAIIKLLDYININLSNSITLDNAAKIAGFSKSHFAKLFKDITGFTFNNYLQLQRLQKAQRLLEKTEDSITEISFECGFMSSGYFATVFRNYFGISPLSYRNNKYNKY